MRLYQGEPFQEHWKIGAYLHLTHEWMTPTGEWRVMSISRTLNDQCISPFDSWMNDTNWRIMCYVHFKNTERSVHIFIWFVNEWHRLENYVWCPFQEDWTILGHIFIWLMNEWHGLEKYVWCPFQEDWTILGHIFIWLVRMICDVHFKNTTCFRISVEVVYLQRYLVVTWLVPRDIAAISVHVPCTAYSHAPVYVTIRRVHIYIRRVHACLAVTCHLHLWQNDRDPLRTTAVAEYRNESRQRKCHREDNSPAPPPAGTRNRDLSITSPTL